MRWLFLVLTLACAGPAGAEKRTVVVELFTSQGCSSCPPADQLLGELDRLTGGDIDVIPLAFHVDYWNHIGWRDPLSSRRWSSRQRAYGKRLSGGRIYTPQLVVGGQLHVVGSNRSAAVRAIRDSARRLAPITAKLTRTGNRLEVRARGPAGSRLSLVVFESGIVTTVPRGENAGRRLRNDFVVRALVPLRRGVASVQLRRRWTAAQLGAAIIAHDPESRHVTGATRLQL